MPQEVCLVVAVQGGAEVPTKMVGKPQRGVGACRLWVDGKTLLIENDGTIMVPKALKCHIYLLNLSVAVGQVHKDGLICA